MSKGNLAAPSAVLLFRPTAPSYPVIVVPTTSALSRRGSWGFPADAPTTNPTADSSWLHAVQNYDARSYLNVTPTRKATKLN